MKEILIRIGCVLLGVVLTLSTIKIGDVLQARVGSETVLVEEIPIAEASVTSFAEEVAVAENVSLYSEYDAEAEEMLKELQRRDEERRNNQIEDLSIETVSANSIEAAPVKWIKDYPMINSTMLLEEKEQIRSSYEETLAVNAFDKKVIENSTIDFSDVKITILGDSITQASNLSEEEREKYAFPVVLQELLGCKEVVNLGVGGSTISTVGDFAMVERRREIEYDSDVIIVFGGTNDSLFENKWEYGELEYERRMTDGTFCGDADKLFGKIEYHADKNEENYSKLICINPPSTVLQDAVYAIDPGNMVHQREFAKAINEIAPAYRFEVIDFYNNNILNTHDKRVQEEFMPDGIHGNIEGYRIIAEHIASQIIQRIEQ